MTRTVAKMVHSASASCEHRCCCAFPRIAVADASSFAFYGRTLSRSERMVDGTKNRRKYKNGVSVFQICCALSKQHRVLSGASPLVTCLLENLSFLGDVLTLLFVWKRLLAHTPTIVWNHGDGGHLVNSVSVLTVARLWIVGYGC